MIFPGEAILYVGQKYGAKGLPQPKAWPVIGNLLDLDLQNPIQSMMKLAEKYGPVYRLQVPTEDLVVVSSRELAHEVCDESRFDKKVHGPLDVVRDYAGDGLITAHTREANWAKAHRILLPAFGPSSLRPMFGQMLDIAEQMLIKWERQGPSAPIDVSDNMTRLTVDTIALCAFGYRLNSFYDKAMHPFVDAMMRSLIESSARTRRPPLQTHFLLGKKRRYELDRELMHKLADDIIAARKAEGLDSNARDILTTMLTAADPESGERLDETNIRYQMVTFLIAGHETTSGLLSFAIYELLRHPEALATARAQIDAVLGGRRPTFDDMFELTYVDQILKESLRLWPTVPAFAVFSKEPQTTLLGHLPVTNRQTILLLLPAVHRDPVIWKNPGAFLPERMAREKFDALPADSWKPFGNGQRSCIGRAFALQEAALALTLILQRFDLKSENPGADLKIKESLTLKPDRFFVTARPRAKSVESKSSPATRAVTPAKPAAFKPRGTLHILFGSKTGTAKGYAQDLCEQATVRGFAAVVQTLDEGFASGILSGPSATAVLITASYEGQAPDNGRTFFEALARRKMDAPTSLRYAVFGCGHRDWSRTYQAVPKFFDQRLAQLGAERICPRGEGDARADSLRDFNHWCEGFWAAMEIQTPSDPAIVRALRRFGLEEAGELLPAATSLSEPVTEAQLNQLLAFTHCPPDRAKLNALIAGRNGELLIDVIESVPSCSIPLRKFVALLN